MTRYFPELVEAVKAELPERCVLDGEIVIATDDGLDFEALQQRIHPAASRVTMLAEQTPASFIAFDLLALGDDDYTGRPFAERRAALSRGAGRRAARRSTSRPTTTDVEVAAALVHRVRGRRPRRRDRQAARRHLPAGQAGDVQDQARAHRRLRARRLPLAQDLDRGQRRWSGRCCSASTTTRASCSTSASSVRSPPTRRAELVDELEPLLLGDGDEHPWQEWASAEAHQGQRLPGAVSRWNATKDLSFVPLRPER